MTLFPSNNIWNTPVDNLPLAPNSAEIIALIVDSNGIAKLRIDDVIPLNLVDPAGQAPVTVTTTNDQSDPGLYPIPPSGLVEVGSDAHMIVVDITASMLYELYNAQRQADGSWVCDSCAKWDLLSNALRPDGWTSADAAGLAMAPGILRYEEILAGEVTHALRFTAPRTFAYAYLWPARHYASHDTTANLPQMGERLRLKADVDITPFSAVNQTILRGLKKYGLMLADNGMPYGCQHDQDSRWDANDLVNLHNVPGSAFEVVSCGAVIVDKNQGAAQLHQLDRCGRVLLPPPPPTLPVGALYSYWRVPQASGVNWQWKPVIVDAPLVLVADADGNAHLRHQ